MRWPTLQYQRGAALLVIATRTSITSSAFETDNCGPESCTDRSVVTWWSQGQRAMTRQRFSRRHAGSLLRSGSCSQLGNVSKHTERGLPHVCNAGACPWPRKTEKDEWLLTSPSPHMNDCRCVFMPKWGSSASSVAQSSETYVVVF